MTSSYINAMMSEGVIFSLTIFFKLTCIRKKENHPLFTPYIDKSFRSVQKNHYVFKSEDGTNALQHSRLFLNKRKTTFAIFQSRKQFILVRHMPQTKRQLCTFQFQSAGFRYSALKQNIKSGKTSLTY